MKSKFVFIFFTLALFVSCSNEIARIHFNEDLESGDCNFNLTESGVIEVWTDLELEYIEPFSLVYTITLMKENENVYEQVCNCFDVDYKKFSVMTQLNNKHSVKYQGRLKCKIGKLEKGQYILNVQPIVRGKEFKLKKIDVFIKN